MCPTNRIGTVDLFVVSHHGQAISNSEVLVHALQPRVACMNNGTRKGGQPDAMKVFYSSPGLEDLWQMHFSLLSGQEYTVPGMFIANTHRRAADRDADRGDAGAGTGPGRAATAGAQRRGLLGQGVGAVGRLVHGHQRAQRIQQNLRRTIGHRGFRVRMGRAMKSTHSRTFSATIVRDGAMCFIPLPFDPRDAFGKVRAPVKVTLNGYSYRSTIAAKGGPPCVPLRRSHREALVSMGVKHLPCESISIPRSARRCRRPIWSRRSRPRRPRGPAGTI